MIPNNTISKDMVSQINWNNFSLYCMAPQIDGERFLSLCDALQQLDGEPLLSFGKNMLRSCTFYQYLFLSCRDRIPKEQLYQTTLGIYFQAGFGFPKQAILDIKDLRPDDYLKDLPPQYKSCDKLPVVRATTTPQSSIQEVGKEMSWTTNYYYLQQMLSMKAKHGETNLYWGVIDKKDIIGCNSFNKDYFEIVQYDSVQNITPFHHSYLLQRHNKQNTSIDDYEDIIKHNALIDTKLKRVTG